MGTPQERVELYEGLGRVHAALHEWAAAQDAYEQLLAQARDIGDREMEWRALHDLATLGVDDGNVTQAEYGGEVDRRLHRSTNAEEGDRRGARSTGPAAAQSFTWSLSAARTREVEALDIAQSMGRDDLVVQSVTALGVLEAHSGRWERALAAAEEAIAVCSCIRDEALAGQLLSLAARSLTMTGRPAEAVRRMRAHPGLTGALGDRTIHRADVFSLAIALTETGDYERALAMAREGVAAARSVVTHPA